MTKFINLNTGSKKTVFTKCVTSDFKIEEANSTPDYYDNVLYIGYDIDYGDVFKAWSYNENNFVILFGTKGDEF